MLDLSLTPDQEQLVATVRDFCAREFAPRIAADDRAGRHDPEIFAKLASIGLPGVCFPQRYGGFGLDYLALGLVCEELEYVDTVFRTVLSVHVGLVGMGLYTWATEDQKQRWLAPMARGEKLACYGLTEPNAGSDVASMQATARRSGSRYVLNGQKVWISDADTADYMLVFAKTDTKAGHKGVTAFMVDRATAGKALRTEPIAGRLGIHAGDVGSIFMSDLEVDERDRIGDEGDGFKIAMSCLDNGRYTVGAGATGTVRASLDASVKYARERKTFGQEIGRYQLVQQMIARMSRDYEICRLLYFKVAYLKNKGVRHTREVSMSKQYATDAAFNAANDAIEVHGAYGYSAEYPVERFLRNARGPIIYEGTREIHTVLQGEYALGYRQDRPVKKSLPPYEPD
ncbi:MAG TPA: acyl-CoA dehydrogenase family protein [Candidatus Dormibacteraeota bacterium]|nr:acyl-CoA dehydrogenase family protein [Candidatus Dormibacteraeota bacterium]